MKRDLCIMACAFCRDPLFLRWLEHLAVQCGTAGEFDEAGAKEFILVSCQIASRNELDTDPAAATRFHALVREPFIKWRDRDKSGFYAGPLGAPWQGTAD